MDNCLISCQAMADMDKFYDDQIINTYVTLPIEFLTFYISVTSTIRIATKATSKTRRLFPLPNPAKKPLLELWSLLLMPKSETLTNSFLWRYNNFNSKFQTREKLHNNKKIDFDATYLNMKLGFWWIETWNFSELWNKFSNIAMFKLNYWDFLVDGNLFKFPLVKLNFFCPDFFSFSYSP